MAKPAPTPRSLSNGPPANPGLKTHASFGSLDNFLVGWTAGGGFEWMFSRNLSLKAEYLLYDLGHVDYSSSPLVTSFAGAPASELDPSADIGPLRRANRAGRPELLFRAVSAFAIWLIDESKEPPKGGSFYVRLC